MHDTARFARAGTLKAMGLICNLDFMLDNRVKFHWKNIVKVFLSLVELELEMPTLSYESMC